MSEPSAAWISMLSSGVSSIFEPSRWFWKRTPSSVILRSFASDQTWKPPESVRIGFCQVRESMQTAQFPDQLMPGPQPEVVGISQNDLRAELLQLRRDAGSSPCPACPTGMKIGVSTVPCGKTSRPRRAEDGGIGGENGK